MGNAVNVVQRVSGVSAEHTDMLRVRNLSGGYGTHHVLRNVRLTVPEGAFVALVGHNGAGKSTLLETITGHLRNSTGDVSLRGTELRGMSPAEIARAGIGYVPQGQSVFPSLTIGENLRVGAALRGDYRAGQDAQEFVFDLFPILKTRLTLKAGSLSGGQRQMLAIAMSLISGPKLMVMDEPSTGLAPVLAAEVLAACKRINEELGTALLVVEAELTRILDLADQVTVLKLGEVVFEGTPTDLQSKDLASLF